MANNRELSQFASFVEVGISSIGFTTSVGIGTTNTQGYELYVNGDVNVAGIVTATTFIGAVAGTATTTTNIPNLTGAITSNNTTTSLGSFTSANLAAALSDETGSGAAVFATSPTLVTPVLGAASATSINVSGIITATTFVGALTGTATSTTNIPNLTGDISSSNTVTTLATVNSNVGTFGGTGAIPVVTVNGKGLVTGISTVAPNNGTLTLAVSGTGLSGSASFTANQSGASTFTVTSNATSANTVSTIVARDGSGNFSAGTITASLTGTATTTTNIPNLTGAITSNNTTTSLGSFTSANLAAALTDETGSGANVFATSPTLVTPVLGAATATSVTASGAITANSYNVGADVGISTTRTTVATTAATTIDSFAIASFRSARIQVQITQSTNYQASDILIIHDGTTASIVEYGSIATNDYLGTFSASVSGGNCLLRINMSSATSSTVKVLSQRITI
jgi:hypothetical protein